MSDLVISSEAKKILSRWARDEFYVYIRCITSRFVNVTEKHRLYWSVSVEFRTTQPIQKRGEGYDLSEIIVNLGAEIPRRKQIQPGYQGKQEKPNATTQNAGWLMPDSVKLKKVKTKLKKVDEERPKKRPKDLKAKKKDASNR